MLNWWPSLITELVFCLRDLIKCKIPYAIYISMAHRINLVVLDNCKTVKVCENIV